MEPAGVQHFVGWARSSVWWQWCWQGDDQEGKQPGNKIGPCPAFAPSCQASLLPAGMEDGEVLCLLFQKRDLSAPKPNLFVVQMQPSGRFGRIQETLNPRAGAGFILR